MSKIKILSVNSVGVLRNIDKETMTDMHYYEVLFVIKVELNEQEIYFVPSCQYTMIEDLREAIYSPDTWDSEINLGPYLNIDSKNKLRKEYGITVDGYYSNYKKACSLTENDWICFIENIYNKKLSKTEEDTIRANYKKYYIGQEEKAFVIKTIIEYLATLNKEEVIKFKNKIEIALNINPKKLVKSDINYRYESATMVSIFVPFEEVL